MSDTISHNDKQISTEKSLTMSGTISHNGKQISTEKMLTISEVKQSDERPYTCVTATVNLTSVGKFFRQFYITWDYIYEHGKEISVVGPC
jgi:hypothetical protein